MADPKEPKVGPDRKAPKTPGGGPAVLDAEKIREAARRQTERGGPPRRRPTAPPVEPAPAAVDPQAAQFWGRQYAALWNQLASARGWPLMPGAPVDPSTGIVKPAADPATFTQNIGEPVARSMDRILPAIDERPWMQVAFLSLPFILGAVVIEGARAGRYLRERRNVAAGRPSSRAGADGAREDRVHPGVDQDAGLTPGLQPSGDR